MQSILDECYSLEYLVLWILDNFDIIRLLSLPKPMDISSTLDILESLVQTDPQGE